MPLVHYEKRLIGTTRRYYTEVMSLQEILGYIFLALGAIWAAVLLAIILRQKQTIRDEAGKSLPTMLITESVVYFLVTMGISDFLMNTIVFNRYKSGDTAILPGTVNLCAIVPGTIVAFTYLRSAEPLETTTLIICTACMIIGAVFGSIFLTGIDGSKLKKIIAAALVFSMCALIVKMIVSAGTTGSASGISGARLIIAVLVCLLCGLLNVMGVPCKPTLTALFLLLGLSPMCTLTLVLVMCGFSPLVAGIKFVRNGKYHKRTVLSALTAGTVTAVFGCLVMISLPALALNIVLLCVMLIAIISMFKN